MDHETQTGPESLVWNASLGLRWYIRPIHRSRTFHPYLTAGAGYHHLRLIVRQADGTNPTRFTAAGGGVQVGVGLTSILAAFLTVDVRLVYRAFRFGAKHWQGALLPVARSCCGGTAGWAHLIALEIGGGTLF